MLGIPLLPLILASASFDAIVAGSILFLGRGHGDSKLTITIGLRRLSLAVLATGFLFAIKALVLRKFGVDSFGLIHLIYDDLVIVIPALGFAVLAAWFARWRLPTTTVRVVAWASLGLIPIGIFATWIEPYRLQLETARLELPAGKDGSGTVRVGVLTDLQTNLVGDYERRAVDLLMAQRPDVILLPGDVFQGSDEEFEATKGSLRDLLGRLKAPGGVYLVLGDTDGPGDLLAEVVREEGIRLLSNEIARVSVKGRRVAIGGVPLAYDAGPARDLVDRLEREGAEGEIRILLAHRPDVVFGLRPGSKVDLVVAGHTHGGQVVIPGFGPPMTLSGVPRSVAAGGLHRVDGHPIYVSRGVGHERAQAPRIRFLCPPEVSVVELDAPTSK